jgi:quaternary ammonium compound-resistance protein SugE
MAWLILIAAGFFEIGFTTCLKLSENFTNWKWTAGFLVCSSISFLLLNRATQIIPLGTAYAVWTGIGAAGTIIIGMILFKEPSDFWRLFFIVLLVISIIGLKLMSSH